MSEVLASLAAALALAAPVEAVTLRPTGASRIEGRVVYRAAGTGTSVTVRLAGAPAGAAVRVLFQSGTCVRHGASFALAGRGRATADGGFGYRGSVLFHGRPVGTGVVADGRHIFTVVVNGRQAACARIPGMD